LDFSAILKFSTLHTVIFFWAKLVRYGRIRAVEVRPEKFRAKFSHFGRISSIAQPKNLLIWGNFAQIEKNSPEIFGAKLNCAGSPFSGEKNTVQAIAYSILKELFKRGLHVKIRNNRRYEGKRKNTTPSAEC
jgi:hypothetical protein